MANPGPFHSPRPAHLGRCAADLKANASAAGPLSGVWGQGDRVFGGLGAHWGGSWRHISEQNGGLEDTGGRHGGSGGTWRGSEGLKYQFWLPYWYTFES